MKKLLFLLTQVMLIGAQVVVFFMARNEITELKVEALNHRYRDVVWEVNQTVIQKTEEITEDYYANAKKDVYIYEHPQDKSLRVTLESAAMKLLLKDEYIVIKNGVDGEHLTLTVYFNPLKVKDPQPKDLIPVHRVVKYRVPDIVFEIEEEAELLEKESDSEEVECIDTYKQLLTPNYPFEETQKLAEVDKYIIYEENLIEENMLNIDFYRLYLAENSIYGSYGNDFASLSQESTEE